MSNIIRTKEMDEVEIYMEIMVDGVPVEDWHLQKVDPWHKTVPADCRRCPSCHGGVNIHTGSKISWHAEHRSPDDAEKCDRSPYAKNQKPRVSKIVDCADCADEKCDLRGQEIKSACKYFVR